MRGHVLVASGDPASARQLTRALVGLDYAASSSLRVEEAVERAESGGLDAMVVDLDLADRRGFELCDRVTRRHSLLPVLTVTTVPCLDSAVRALRAGAADFLARPVDPVALGEALDRLIARMRRRIGPRAQRRLAAVSRPYHGMVGRSASMREVFGLIERIARSDATVLVTGESGTGKERAARAIHAASGRRDGPFLSIGCNAVPESLIESELFGHLRGAFTDADRDRPGLFHRAEGGTLFLDEIGDLSPAVQPKLLRALQERAVRPLGSGTELSFDVRIIASTRLDLEQEASEGRFRADLLFRLQVIRLELPPLRQREDDILLLAESFLRKHAARSGKRVSAISVDATARLRAYDWPGNVRELESCLQSAVAIASGRVIGIHDLPVSVRMYRPRVIIDPRAGSLFSTLREAERDHILRVLHATGSNQARAARILGIDRKTLARRLASYEP